MENTQLYADPWSRIQAVHRYSGVTSINAFAFHIGLPRGENLYQIKKGNNRISPALAERICNLYPEINPGWLLTGRGEMFFPDPAPKPESEPEPAPKTPSDTDRIVGVLTKIGEVLDDIRVVLWRRN